MATVEVPQSLENKVGQLNVAPILEVQNFTNCKKRFLCHILGIEPQFKNIIKNGPFIPMTAGQRKPKVQWTGDERKAAKIDQRLKRLSRYIDDEEDTSSHEYLNDLEEEYQARALLAKSKRFFKKGTQRFSSVKATDQTECHKCGKKDDNEMVKVKVLMALAEENDAISKEVARNGEWVKISMRKAKDLVFVKSLADDTKVSIPGVERPWLSKVEGFILLNHDTGRILPTESQRNTTDPLVVVIDSSVTDYDSTDKSSVCSTPLPTLKKLDGAEPISRPKTIKLILRSKSTFKAKTLKGVITN
nr:retrovirus-related Pol polyprotein from transposon TNT 1-94 [Tanacetum cinerariifolium]